MERECACVPPPHDLVQLVQAPKADTMQSTGHDSVLQERDSCRRGQTYPPCAACAVTLRVRCSDPAPHVLLQAVQLLHLVVSQWIGHGPSLQGCPSSSSGHPMPPKPAPPTTERLRVCRPRPHETEHSLQSLKFDTSQSIGHGCTLHDWSDVRVGHALPPWREAVVTVRLRLCTPVPQLVVHVDHCSQVEVAQSTGHAPSAQDLVSASSGQT